jgi:ABC-type methionine transport system permease subunit
LYTAGCIPNPTLVPDFTVKEAVSDESTNDDSIWIVAAVGGILGIGGVGSIAIVVVLSTILGLVLLAVIIILVVLFCCRKKEKDLNLVKPMKNDDVEP